MKLLQLEKRRMENKKEKLEISLPLWVTPRGTPTTKSPRNPIHLLLGVFAHPDVRLLSEEPEPFSAVMTIAVSTPKRTRRRVDLDGRKRIKCPLRVSKENQRSGDTPTVSKTSTTSGSVGFLFTVQ